MTIVKLRDFQTESSDNSDDTEKKPQYDFQRNISCVEFGQNTDIYCFKLRRLVYLCT